MVLPEGEGRLVFLQPTTSHTVIRQATAAACLPACLPLSPQPHRSLFSMFITQRPAEPNTTSHRHGVMPNAHVFMFFITMLSFYHTWKVNIFLRTLFILQTLPPTCPVPQQSTALHNRVLLVSEKRNVHVCEAKGTRGKRNPWDGEM